VNINPIEKRLCSVEKKKMKNINIMNETIDYRNGPVWAKTFCVPSGSMDTRKTLHVCSNQLFKSGKFKSSSKVTQPKKDKHSQVGSLNYTTLRGEFDL
jgi:hypothetical protein